MQENKLTIVAQEEAILIRNIQSGLKGLDLLIIKYQDLVYRYSLTCTGKTSDAEDLTQEVFIKLFTNIKNIDAEKPLVHWLLKVTKNANINFLNRIKNEKN